jgi:hypothetical protein
LLPKVQLEPIMPYADLTFLILTLAGTLYLAMFVLTLRARRLREQAVVLIQVFLLVSAAWLAVQALLRLAQAGQLAGFDTFALERTSLYLLLAQALLFFKLTALFERRSGHGLYSWLAGGLFLATSIIFYENMPRLPELVLRTGSREITPWLLAFTILVLGWGGFMGGAVLMTIRAYRNSSSPLHKNRNKYWSLAVAFTVTGQGLLLGRILVPGVTVQLLAVFIAVYVLLTYHLPDLRLAARRIGIYLLVMAISLLLYTAVLYEMQALSHPGSSNPLLLPYSQPPSWRSFSIHW